MAAIIVLCRLAEQSARERWDGVMRAYKVPLKVYLALEVYPGEAR